MKHGDLSMKNGDLSMKNGDLSCSIHQKQWFDQQLYIYIQDSSKDADFTKLLKGIDFSYSTPDGSNSKSDFRHGWYKLYEGGDDYHGIFWYVDFVSKMEGEKWAPKGEM